jgi:hypothetical protein
MMPGVTGRPRCKPNLKPDKPGLSESDPGAVMANTGLEKTRPGKGPGLDIIILGRN